MIPRWQILNMTHCSGARLPKKPKWEPWRRESSSEVCPLCKGAMHSRTYDVPTERWICGRCWSSMRNWRQDYSSRSGTGYTPARNLIILNEIKGNLDNTDYRWWVGNRIYHSHMNQQAMCRRCRMYLYSPAERMEHKEKFTPSCIQALNQAYKLLMDKPDRRCIVCGDRCTTTQWGIPMHSTPSCMNRWRFDYQKYPMLQLALKQCDVEVTEPTQLYLGSGDEDEFAIT